MSFKVYIETFKELVKYLLVQCNNLSINFIFRKNMAVIHFFFEETQFTGFTKGELFGFTEFLCKSINII